MSGALEQARFFGKLGTLMSAGVPVLKAFEVALQRVKEPGLGGALSRILDRAYGGCSFLDAFKEEEVWFSPEILCLIEAGEQTGDLDRKAGSISEGITRGDLEVGGESIEVASDRLEKWLDMAHASGVTALHADPAPEGWRLKHRIDGTLREAEAPADLSGLIERCRFRAGLAAGPAPRPRRGEFGIGDLRVRLSAFPFAEGEAIVLRFVAPPRVLKSLGLRGKGLSTVLDWCGRGSGLVVAAAEEERRREELLAALAVTASGMERKLALVGAIPAEELPGACRVLLRPEEGFDRMEALRELREQDVDVIVLDVIDGLAVLDQTRLAARGRCLVLAGVAAPDASAALERLHGWRGPETDLKIHGAVARPTGRHGVEVLSPR